MLDTNLHISKESTFFCFTNVKSMEEPKLREMLIQGLVHLETIEVQD